MANGHNDWGVEFSRITFLEKVLTSHDNVLRFTRDQDILFSIERKAQSDELRLLCCDEYALGMAAVLRGLQEFGTINIFFVGGAWNGYTHEAKAYCTKSSIGVYNSKELAGALWQTKYWDYSRRDEEGNKEQYFKAG